MGYMDRPQSLDKEVRREKVISFFIEHYNDDDINSIADIARATGISKSSVQRYLSDVENIHLLKIIKEFLMNSKKKGLSEGGKNSGYSKDASGKFTGGQKK